jgi:RpiB/LacA/LacB family sugar-phosphate isomerase
MPDAAEIREIVRRIVEGLELDDVPASPAEPTDQPVVAVGADHGGYPLKERIGFRLKEAGYEVIDCGTGSTDSVDYPDFAHEVASKVASGEATYGVIVDGAGIGSAMTANKVPGVRAALCYDLSTARNSREHNHANVLTLGASLVGDGLAWQITQEWLATLWGPGRHAARIDKMMEYEQRYLRDDT